MRRTAITVGVSLALLAFMPMIAPQVSAAPEDQLLWADGMISYDQTLYSNGTGHDALNRVNRTPTLWSDSDDADDNYYDKEPGIWLWGDATNPTTGDFGTAELRFTVTDLIGETSAYYNIAVNVISTFTLDDPVDGDTTKIDTVEGSTETLSFRIGFGYTDAATGSSEHINSSYRNASGHKGTVTSGDSILWSDPDYLQANEPFDRPWTADEINHLYVVLQMRFEGSAISHLEDNSPTPINFALAYIVVLATVNDTYTPTTPPEGRFILRPSGDTYSNGFVNYSVDDYEGMYGALNDTTQHGDAEQSFINATWAKAAFVGLKFTDPPAWAQDIEYKVTLWSIIRQTEVTPGAFYTLTMSISSDGLDQKVYYPTTSYTNNTHESLYIPGSADFWGLTDLEDIQANIWLNWVGSTPDGEMRVTQMAFLCTPIIPGDYVPDTGEFTDDTFIEWITADGIFTIFGIMGGIGLIAGAPLAILFYKSGKADGPSALGIAVGIIFVSMCFILVGLSPYS